MINEALAKQGNNTLMCAAWANRPTDKATHYCPATRGYYSVCEFSTEFELYLWCHVNAEWVAIEDDLFLATMQRVKPFEPEHRVAV